MNEKVVNVLMFAAGAAIGSAVTWKIVKTKYERITQEEIESVKKEYNNLINLTKKEKSVQNESEDETSDDEEYYPDDDERELTEHERQMVEYYKLTSRYRGSSDTENGKEGDEGEEEESDDELYDNGPYAISPEDFNNSPGYSCQPLDYYSDGILADGWGIEVDIDDTIGEEALNHFDEYVDDVVYVRNEAKEIDYEVTRDPRTYEEAVRLTLKT